MSSRAWFFLGLIAASVNAACVLHEALNQGRFAYLLGNCIGVAGAVYFAYIHRDAGR